MGGPPKRGAYGHQANNYFGDVNDNADGGEKGEEARGININEAAKGVGEEDIDMIIDLDTTDDMLGNLQNLPFLKDDGINIHLASYSFESDFVCSVKSCDDRVSGSVSFRQMQMPFRNCLVMLMSFV
ncbi:uncharacterized protein A4U43_C03F19030 [Asparagus officinalis]|uniref:Uncharacterized protein n=1 Tax=Asparagus officinalis TaxID=4686 RepID=A0A5P1FD40_ASPOF|nr:uncharacterized protein A4U43_C03F19030 [Asparagus officinalis]